MVSAPRASAALRVTASQVAVAGTSYLALAAGGRVLDSAAFAALSSFYLVLNVVGRGLLSATELDLTRAVAAAGGDRTAVARAVRRGVRGAGVLAAVGVGALVVASPVLLRALGGDVVLLALLGLTVPGMAAGYLLRGPLAGSLRYGPYAASYGVEAGVIAAGAVVAALAGSTDPRAWALGLALGPLVGAGVAAWPLRARGRALLRVGGRAPAVPGHGRDLAAAVVVLGCAQAVFNVPPVLLAASSPDVAVVAGFAAVAIVLRAPVMLFPGLQAMLLPALAARPGSLARPPARALAVAAALVVGWLVAAVGLTPPVVGAVLGAQVLPGTAVLAALALATVLGGVAQGAQTALVARRRLPATAGVWAVAVGTLAAVVLLGPPTPGWTAAGLLAGTAVAATGFGALLARGGLRA